MQIHLSCSICFHLCRVNNIDICTAEQASGLEMAKLDRVQGIKVFKDTNNKVKAATLDKELLWLRKSHNMRCYCTLCVAGLPSDNVPWPSHCPGFKWLHRKHREKYSQTSRILQQVYAIFAQSVIPAWNDFISLTKLSLFSAPNHWDASH